MEYLDLLDAHGRIVVDNLGRLSPEAVVPPIPLSVRATAEDHWSTLEVWVRSLKNPAVHWSKFAESEPPEEYSALVAAIAEELERLSRSFATLDPDTRIDYFGRPGTVVNVARLLAHEVIQVAHASALAAGLSTSPVSPAVASDGIDRALHHWASHEPVERKEKIVAIRCTDTGQAWHLALNGEDNFRLVAPANAAVHAGGRAQDLLWWLHGHATPKGAVTLEGDKKTIRDLWANLMLSEIEVPKRRWFS